MILGLNKSVAICCVFSIFSINSLLVLIFIPSGEKLDYETFGDFLENATSLLGSFVFLSDSSSKISSSSMPKPSNYYILELIYRFLSIRRS